MQNPRMRRPRRRRKSPSRQRPSARSPRPPSGALNATARRRNGRRSQAAAAANSTPSATGTGPFRRVALRGTIQRWISLRVTLGAPRATDRAFHALPPKDIRETLSRSLTLLCVSAPRGPQAPSRLVEHLHFHVLSYVPPSPSLCWVRAWAPVLEDNASRKTARVAGPAPS